MFNFNLNLSQNKKQLEKGVNNFGKMVGNVLGGLKLQQGPYVSTATVQTKQQSPVQQQQPVQQYQQPPQQYQAPVMQQQYPNLLAKTIISECEKSFDVNYKLQVITNFSSSQVNPMGASDLMTILGFFTQQIDQLKVLTHLKQTNNIALMSCSEAKVIIELFFQDIDKFKAFSELGSQIYDGNQNAEMVAKSFHSHVDQENVRQILIQQAQQYNCNFYNVVNNNLQNQPSAPVMPQQQQTQQQYSMTQVNTQVVPPNQQVIYQQQQPVIQQSYQAPPQQYTSPTTQPVIMQKQPVQQQQPQQYQQPPIQQYQPPIMQQQNVSPMMAPQQQNSLGQTIITACKNCSFDSDKLKTLTTYSQSQVNPINGNDLLTILNFFSFESDKLKALQQLKKTNNIGQMSCQEACSIISLFSFDSDKMKAITEIAPHIYDKQNAELVAKKVSFASDQEKIRKLLLPPTTTTKVNTQVVPPKQQVIYQQSYQFPTQQYTMQPVMQQYPNLLGKNIITACSKCSYQSDKLNTVTTYSSSQVDPIGGGDLLTILKMFQYQSDKLGSFEQLKKTNNVGQMSCKEAASIISLFTNQSDRLKVATDLALNIYDRKQNPEVVVALLSYNSDKEKVRKMLLQ